MKDKKLQEQVVKIPLNPAAITEARIPPSLSSWAPSPSPSFAKQRRTTSMHWLSLAEIDTFTFHPGKRSERERYTPNDPSPLQSHRLRELEEPMLWKLVSQELSHIYMSEWTRNLSTKAHDIRKMLCIT